MGRRAKREWQSAHHCHTFVEAHQLHRDLTLIVIHGQYRLKIIFQRTQEHCVSRKRAIDVETLGFRCPYCRLNNVDFFHAKATAITGMWVEPGHCNLRIVVSRFLQAHPSQFQLGENSFNSQGRGYILERNMRSHARVPDFLQNVELTHLACEAQHIGNKADFVVVTRISEPHRLLVERRKTNSLRMSSISKFQCGTKVLGCESSANQRGFATHNVLRIEILQVNEDMFADRHVRRIFEVGILQIKLNTRNMRTFVQNAAITEDDDMRFFSDIRQSEQTGCQLWTDTSWIPHCKRDHARFSASNGH